MEYDGVKFQTKFTNKFLNPGLQLDEFIYWCSVFGRYGLAPIHPEGSYGNLSYRDLEHPREFKGQVIASVEKVPFYNNSNRNKHLQDYKPASDIT